MGTNQISISFKTFSIVLISFQIIFFQSVLFDIPLLRQFVGFLFLLIIPGLLLYSIFQLKLDEISEKIILMCTFSLAFLLIFGLLQNTLFTIFKWYEPLSDFSILISLNIICLSLFILSFFINRKNSFKIKRINFGVLDKGLLSLSILLPPISLFGNYCINYFNQNFINIILIILIVLIIVFITFFENRINEQLFPIYLFLIGLSLSLLWATRSQYLLFGADNDWEYYIFNQVMINQRWENYTSHLLDACLSISLLPGIFQKITNINSYLIFKIFFPIVSSFLLVIIYFIFRKFTIRIFAFYTAIIFLSFYNFFGTNNRINIALIFFYGIILVLFSEKIERSMKFIIVPVFLFACTISHYTTTYFMIFLFVTSFLVIKIVIPLIYCLNLILQNIYNKNKKFTLCFQYKKNILISWPIIFLSVTLIYFWYAIIVEIPFIGGVNSASSILQRFHYFLDLDSRSNVIQFASGSVSYLDGGIASNVEWIISWVIIVLICLGFFTLLNYIILPSKNGIKDHFTNSDIFIHDYPLELFCLSFSGLILIASSIFLPFWSVIYEITRVYFQNLGLIAFFFIIGIVTLFNGTQYIKNSIVNKKNKTNFSVKRNQQKKYIKFCACLIIILYFVCTSGLLYQITASPRSLFFNSKGNQFYDIVTTEQESSSIKWLEKAQSTQKLPIFTDTLGRFRVIIEGLFSPYLYNVDNLYFDKINNDKNEGYIFLRGYNLHEQKILTNNKRINLDNFSKILYSQLKIYNNDGSTILLTLP